MTLVCNTEEHIAWKKAFIMPILIFLGFIIPIGLLIKLFFIRKDVNYF